MFSEVYEFHTFLVGKRMEGHCRALPSLSLTLPATTIRQPVFFHEVSTGFNTLISYRQLPIALYKLVPLAITDTYWSVHIIILCITMYYWSNLTENTVLSKQRMFPISYHQGEIVLARIAKKLATHTQPDHNSCRKLIEFFTCTSYARRGERFCFRFVFFPQATHDDSTASVIFLCLYNKFLFNAHLVFTALVIARQQCECTLNPRYKNVESKSFYNTENFLPDFTVSLP